MNFNYQKHIDRKLSKIGLYIMMEFVWPLVQCGKALVVNYRTPFLMKGFLLFYLLKFSYFKLNFLLALIICEILCGTVVSKLKSV